MQPYMVFFHQLSLGLKQSLEEDAVDEPKLDFFFSFLKCIGKNEDMSCSPTVAIV